MKMVEMISEQDARCPLEPWEMAFLRTGEEPGPRHCFLFSILYETADWYRRWEAAADRIVAEWTRMPLSERPMDWIRYLQDIGYLSAEAKSLLEKDGRRPVALTA